MAALLTTAEAINYIGFRSRWELTKAIREYQLPYTRVGPHFRFDKRALHAWANTGLPFDERALNPWPVPGGWVQEEPGPTVSPSVWRFCPHCGQRLQEAK